MIQWLRWDKHVLPQGTMLVSRAMLTVGVGRIGGAEDLEEGELGL